MTFVSLEPTRMPISSPSVTMSDPTSKPLPVLALDEGLAIGLGLFIWLEEGEAAGISISGLCRCVCPLDADGLGVASGVGLAVGFDV